MQAQRQLDSNCFLITRKACAFIVSTLYFQRLEFIIAARARQGNSLLYYLVYERILYCIRAKTFTNEHEIKRNDKGTKGTIKWLLCAPSTSSIERLLV